MAPVLVTLNMALTRYHSGGLRDVQLAGQLDRKLGEVAGFGNATLTMAGSYQWMKEVVTGHIGVFQTKLSLPAGKTVKIPFSVTWANRTELIKEKDVRGQVGLTLDMDSLFRQ